MIMKMMMMAMVVVTLQTVVSDKVVFYCEITLCMSLKYPEPLLALL